jgi:hypothetical protein
MKYTKIIFILRLLIYIYKYWHFYESNNTLIRQIKDSKIYNSILSIHKYNIFIKECSHIHENKNVKLPYLLRLSEFIMTTENTQLYTRVYKITKCIHDPEILTNQFMELIDINNTLPFELSTNVKGMNELYKMTNDFEYFSKKLLSSTFISISEYKNILHEYKIRNLDDSLHHHGSHHQGSHHDGSRHHDYTKVVNTNNTKSHFYYLNILIGATYEICKETVKYFFYMPTHTPLYDTIIEIQKNMKLYYRILDESYRSLNYLAIDIIDEIQMFSKKFKILIQSSIHLYYSTGCLLSEIAGFIYGNENSFFLFETLHIVLFH